MFGARLSSARAFGDIRVSWGTVAIVTVPNSGIQPVRSSCLAMGDFGRMPSNNSSNMMAATDSVCFLMILIL